MTRHVYFIGLYATESSCFELCREIAKLRRFASWIGTEKTDYTDGHMKLSTPLSPAVATVMTLLFAGYWLRESGAQSQKPDTVVRKLYREVVRLHPMGVPQGSDKAAIWPFLSKRLTGAFETRDACDLNWDLRHKHADPPLKAPGFYEDVLFTGSNERGYVDGATIYSVKSEPDGSYLVQIRLRSYFDGGDVALRGGKIYRWRVAAKVVQEHGQFVVDDVLGYKGVFSYDKPVYMSTMLKAGCRGKLSSAD